MDLGAKLKQAREHAELTQQMVADQLHVTRAAVSNWENGRSTPDIELLTQLSRLYDQSLDEWTGSTTAAVVPWYQRPQAKGLIVALLVLVLGAVFIDQIYDAGYVVGKALAYWVGGH